MKITFTKHTLEKIKILKQQGWKVNQKKIKEIIGKPKWRGVTKTNQNTVMGLADNNHILRIILGSENGIIKVITFHIARKGKYESTLR